VSAGGRLVDAGDVRLVGGEKRNDQRQSSMLSFVCGSLLLETFFLSCVGFSSVLSSIPRGIHYSSEAHRATRRKNMAQLLAQVGASTSRSFT
jgi:hypothetical protein